MSGLEKLDLGLRPYDEVWDLQKKLVDKKKNNPTEPDYLLFVEHPDVYTYGQKSSLDLRGAEGDEAISRGLLRSARKDSAQTFLVERGGEATYHNPGQLVVYPILTLPEGRRDLHAYLRGLEQVVIDVLSEYGIQGERRSGATGVWIQGKEKKIASIGVAVRSWVTYHGVALNVCNDLSGFSQINPCGFASSVMTSMEEELGREISLERVKLAFLQQFKNAMIA